MKNKLIFKIFLAVFIIIIAFILSWLLNSYADKRQRDVARLSDIAIIRLGLERYFFGNQSYPIAENAVVLGMRGAKILCDSGQGLRNSIDDCDGMIIEKLPADSLSGQGYVYAYQSNGATYNLDFNLESNDSGLSAGPHRATPEGIR